MESQPQNAKLGDYNSFSDLFSDFLNTIKHLNMKLSIFVGIIQVKKLIF